jgi:hypothetical protein
MVDAANSATKRDDLLMLALEELGDDAEDETVVLAKPRGEKTARERAALDLALTDWAAF